MKQTSHLDELDDWRKALEAAGVYKQKPHSVFPTLRKIPITPRRPVVAPVDHQIEVRVSANFEISDDDWSDLQGTSMLAEMFCNRVQGTAVCTTASPQLIEQAIRKWLADTCTNFYHFEYLRPTDGKFTAYFLSKADSMNFVIYWNGQTVSVPDR